MYRCYQCNHEIEYLDYSYSQTQYGTLRLADEQYEDTDSGDGDNYVFQCSECNSEVNKQTILNSEFDEDDDEEEETTDTLDMARAFTLPTQTLATYDPGAIVPDPSPQMSPGEIETAQDIMHEIANGGDIRDYTNRAQECYRKYMKIIKNNPLTETPLQPVAPQFAKDEREMRELTPAHIKCPDCKFSILLENGQWTLANEFTIKLYSPVECSNCGRTIKTQAPTPIPNMRAY